MVWNGSSPLARGALNVTRGRPHLWGLIPAGAGSTQWLWGSVLQPTAHPRWRGEHASLQCFMDHVYGSSPLARGARSQRRAGD